jgi:putative colanic acid biosynthesis acetyltransferase WcaF
MNKSKKKLILNIQGCRNKSFYSNSEYFKRILWSIAFPFFRFSPRIFFGWRRFLLKLFGAKIGKNANVYPTTYIYLPWKLNLGSYASIGEWTLIYNLGLVSIGDRATISHRAHICAGTHDYQDALLPLLRAPIKIGRQSWICADAFIGPNVNIGEGAIVGAGALVLKNVPPLKIVGGVPAKILKIRKINNK